VNSKLAQIGSAVSKVSDIIGELAGSSRQQTSGIDEISKAMGQMNSVTQQNAASSEESSSAASELSGQAGKLSAMVGTFRIEGGADGAGDGDGGRDLRGASELIETFAQASVSGGACTPRVSRS
jgi:hypothetical protein